MPEMPLAQPKKRLATPLLARCRVQNPRSMSRKLFKNACAPEASNQRPDQMQRQHKKPTNKHVRSWQDALDCDNSLGHKTSDLSLRDYQDFTIGQSRRRVDKLLCRVPQKTHEYYDNIVGQVHRRQPPDIEVEMYSGYRAR